MLATSKSSKARFLLWLALTFVALAAFAAITGEMLEGNTAPGDRAVLLRISEMRSPWLTSVTRDVTWLGSSAALISISGLTLFILIALGMSGDFPQRGGGSRPNTSRRDIAQLIVAVGGAELLTHLTKNIIERPRPEVIPRLVAAAGSSYPSGHALDSTAIYLAIAMILSVQMQARWSRIAILVVAGLIIVAVSFSRLYLGVHYPSDVASGVALGAGWTFLVRAAFSQGGLRQDAGIG